jgi:hypothetical protein
VSKMLRRLEDRALEARTAEVQRMKARATWRLEYVSVEAIRAWERSKGPQTRRRQRQAVGARPGTAERIAELVIDERPGDPRFLEVARRAELDLLKTWGLDTAPTIPVTVAPQSSLAHLTREELRARLRQLVRTADLEIEMPVPDSVPEAAALTDEEKRQANEDAYERVLAARRAGRP